MNLCDIRDRYGLRVKQSPVYIIQRAYALSDANAGLRISGL